MTQRKNKYYNEDRVLKVLQDYSGGDLRIEANIEKLMMVDDAQQRAVASAVASLSNSLPHGGPIVAFEVICEVACLW